MLNSRQLFGRLNHSPQAFVVKFVRRRTRRASPKRRPHRDDVVFFGNILMNNVIGEARERTLSAGEENLDLLRSRMLLDAVENLDGLVLSKHSEFST
jgi:hypothetical protein